MRFTKTVVAASLALLASASANAVITGSIGGGAGPYLTLTDTDLSDGCMAGECTLGSSATVLGGTTYTSDQPFADIPKGGVVGRFLAAGPTSTSPATVTFAPGVSYLSFLWGSPDSYNTLTVNGTAFSVASLGLPGDGNQAFSTYVQFTAVGEFITTVVFGSSIDAFEVANFSTTVPEPGTLALFGAGLVGMWMAVRRRKVSVDSGRGLTAA